MIFFVSCNLNIERAIYVSFLRKPLVLNNRIYFLKFLMSCMIEVRCIYTRLSQKSCKIEHVLNCDAYIQWPKLFKLWKVVTVFGSVVLVDVLTRCALLYFVWDFKNSTDKPATCVVYFGNTYALRFWNGI